MLEEYATTSNNYDLNNEQAYSTNQDYQLPCSVSTKTNRKFSSLILKRDYSEFYGHLQTDANSASTACHIIEFVFLLNIYIILILK